MSLRRLKNAEMVQITKSLVSDATPSNTVLLSKSIMTPMLPILLEAHQGLYKALPQDPPPEYLELCNRSQELDKQHDAQVHVIYGGLTALAASEEDGETFLEIRDALLPAGLKHTQSSFRAEAGHASIVIANLTTAQLKRLGSARLGSSTMRQLVEQWGTTAESLGSVEWQRSQLRTDFEGSGDSRSARNSWIKAVKALVLLATWADLSDDEDRLLFSELRTVEAQADARARRAGADDTAEDDADDDDASEQETSLRPETALRPEASPLPQPSGASEPSLPTAGSAASVGGVSVSS